MTAAPDDGEPDARPDQPAGVPDSPPGWSSLWELCLLIVRGMSSPTLRSAPRSGPVWRSYLDWFHERRPGITEDVLREAVAPEPPVTPYGWLLGAAPPTVRALDVACGSAPLAIAAPEHRWVGVDRSSGELTRAATHGEARLVRGDAGALPFRNESFHLVTCSMGLMLFDQVDVVLSEIHRLVRPGGTVLFLLPGGRPLTIRDRLRYLRVLGALRELRPAYPNDVHILRVQRRLTRVGFEVVSDERRRFAYPVRDEAAGRRFVESLYAPGRPAERLEAAARLAVGWAGSEIGIPLRRVACRKKAA